MKKRIIATVMALVMVSSLSGCGSNASGSGTAKADENGNYVVNGSFENADFTPWVVTNIDDVTEELDVYDRDTDAYEGVQSLHFYSGSSDINFTAEQTISGLESGKYKLTGHIQGDDVGDENASVFFYVEVGGERQVIDTSLDGYVAWNTAELSGIEVDGQDVVVGVSVTLAPGGWGTIDDITLVKE
ncbi:MAG: hypothetical protein E7309_14075 [Butyrivibrio sp.]|jgi:arabinogalactan endo-1,4-beta-galactosidase|nr:hypothetical protein [Butyrivibrio sp.]